MSKVLLGRFKANIDPMNPYSYGAGERVYLEEHEWKCGWYWSFGYLGNKNLHFHFESLLRNHPLTASDLFSETNISDKEWWVIRDLFVQAYALKAAAEVYRHGGHQTSLMGTTDVIQDKMMVPRLNEDLKTVLDTLWKYVTEAVKEKKKPKEISALQVA